MADKFWVEIDAQLDKLSRATTPDEVISILGGKEAASSGDAFFAGSGGDHQVSEALVEAGWRYAWSEASYYWAMRAPNSQDGITYVEGDIYRGVQSPPV
jgi:hypothetical protein